MTSFLFFAGFMLKQGSGLWKVEGGKNWHSYLVPKCCCVIWLQINRLGGGDSDFAAFVQHAGVPALDLHFGDGKGQNLLDQELLTISGELSEMAASLLVELNAIVLRSGRHFKMIQFQGRHTSKGQKTLVVLIWS